MIKPVKVKRFLSVTDAAKALTQPPPFKRLRPPYSWAWWVRKAPLVHVDPVRILRHQDSHGAEGYQVERFMDSGDEARPFGELYPGQGPHARSMWIPAIDLFDMKSAVTHLQCRLTEIAMDEIAARTRHRALLAELAEERAAIVQNVNLVQLRRTGLCVSGNLERSRLAAKAHAEKAKAK